MIQPTSQQPTQDYMHPQHKQQQLLPPQGQNIQQPIQQQNLALQDQSIAMHGQQQQLGNSQMQQMQPQHAVIQSGDTESLYAQAGIEMNSKMEPPNNNYQLQQAQMNGEYHHQGHVSSETESHQPLALYGQPSISPSNPMVPNDTRSSINSQAGSSHISQQMPQQQGSQINNHGSQETQSIGSGGAYSQSATNQIQPQTTQYPPNQHLQNQQMLGDSRGLGHGYVQNQQQQPSMQHGQNLSQQLQQPPAQQPTQQMQNIPQQQQQQQHMQAPMHQQVTHQPAVQQLQQPVPNQQYQMQQDNSQQMDHHQQQPSLTLQHSTYSQNQPQHQSNPQMQGYQIPSNQNHGPPQGQRITESKSGDFVPVVLQDKAPRLSNQEGSVSSHTEHSRNGSQSESMGALEGLSIETNDDDEESEISTAELRKLDQDYEKNLKRAKKVFVNRMDNLQRTQVEREALHQKTLKQHQKDRAAFEKRLKQEEIEQNRRIVQMQKEWDRRREEVRLQEQDESD